MTLDPNGTYLTGYSISNSDLCFIEFSEKRRQAIWNSKIRVEKSDKFHLTASRRVL